MSFLLVFIKGKRGKRFVVKVENDTIIDFSHRVTIVEADLAEVNLDDFV